MIDYTPGAGEHVAQCAERMARLAAAENSRVRATFNDVELIANPGDTADAITAAFSAECSKRRREYQESDEGKAAAARQKEAAKRAREAAAEGILPFQKKDEAAWDEWAKNNQDPYGACTMRYAARWANTMDSLLALGCRLEDIADRASHEADLEGISGFMYGCAVAMLSKAWEHGEELRRWHNLKTQIRNEGEQANESGGVLNPAILNLGGHW